jgi:ureidoglycolate dehydrogenase (NAD+)
VAAPRRSIDASENGRNGILPASTKLVEESDLHALIARVFEAKGLGAADAASVADVLIWAELRGVDSHGLSRIPQYLQLIDEGQLDPSAVPSLEVDLGAACLVDGHRCAGPVAMMQAVDFAAERAARFGIGMTMVGRTTHTGAIGCYADRVARQGLAAITFSAGPPLMAYHGARVASVSTAPIAIAVPGGADGATVLDMATSVVSNGRLKLAKDSGELIPEGWALDRTGAPTTDPDEAVIPLPLGGPKGAGLAFMFESLAGILAGSPILSEMVGPQGRRRHAHNATMIAIDIGRFRPLADFRGDLEKLAGILKELPLQDGHDEIRLPGERGARTARGRKAGGIPVAEKTWRKLAAICGELGLAMPYGKA